MAQSKILSFTFVDIVSCYHLLFLVPFLILELARVAYVRISPFFELIKYKNQSQMIFKMTSIEKKYKEDAFMFFLSLKTLFTP